MTGWAEVEGEVQSYLKREAEAQEVLKLIVTIVVATIMTTGKQEVAILKEIDTLKETTEIKQGILPLRDDMERETVVTTEREIKDQAHQFDIREGMTSLSGMKEEKNEE
uniref:Zinc finger CCCH-type containing 13 n=1 Tax=Rousettus aegyptiacus TaxID=9407 RepID=A0A7J8E0D7_ROUAE|nr:zinc finger CCCH-type containing 13 [Rousettus aegyptiacus]